MILQLPHHILHKRLIPNERHGLRSVSHHGTKPGSQMCIRDRVNKDQVSETVTRALKTEELEMIDSLDDFDFDGI